MHEQAFVTRDQVVSTPQPGGRENGIVFRVAGNGQNVVTWHDDAIRICSQRFNEQADRVSRQVILACDPVGTEFE